MAIAHFFLSFGIKIKLIFLVVFFCLLIKFSCVLLFLLSPECFFLLLLLLLSHSFFLFLLLFHQRCSSTTLSNSTECFHVTWSWTDHLPRRNKRHRKQSQWPLLLFIEWIYSLHCRYHVERSTLRIIREPAFFPQAACVTIAALMQYFFMAAFCWMLIEGIYLYFFVVKVYNINTKMYMYHIISWGRYIILKDALVTVTMLSDRQILCCDAVKCFDFLSFFMGRSSSDHGGHFTWHRCWKRRVTKLYEW